MMRNPRLDDVDQPERPRFHENMAQLGFVFGLAETTEEILAGAFGEAEIFEGSLGAESGTGVYIQVLCRAGAALGVKGNYVMRGGGYEFFATECS